MNSPIPKISVVTFYSLYPNSPGPGGKAVALAEQLQKEGCLHRLVCLDHKDLDNFPRETILNPPHRILYKAISKIYRVLRVAGGRERATKEKLFDFFTAWNKDLLASDLVLFLKPSFPLTVARLRKTGKYTVALASILHPKFNAEQVHRDAGKFGVHDTSTYTNEGRIEKVTVFFEGIDHLLVQSDLAKSVFAEYGFPLVKTTKIKDCFEVDINRFKPLPARKYNKKLKVLHISNMNLIKGIGYLLNAWKTLALPEAELLLGGNMDKNTRDISASINTSNVIKLGPIADPLPVYQQADLFVSPSIADLNPYTVLEAMACGVPVIASDMCGASEIISHGVDGFVYRYDSFNELQELLEWCSINREKLVQMGQRARTKAIRYQRSDFAQKVVALLQQYLDENRGGDEISNP